MARRRDQDPTFTPVVDDETGATYNLAKTQEDFSMIPLSKVRKLGDDSNGLVYLMKCSVRSGVYFAAKKFLLNSKDERKNEITKRTFLKEISCLQKLKHKNIVTLYYSVMGPTQAMFLMNYCRGGALYTDNLTETQIMKYFVSILDAVQYIHYERVIHRDIKLDNILLRHDEVFLTDFGLADSLPKGNDLAWGVVGTLDYMAPEVYNAKTSSAYDGFKADSYSMGVYLWCLLQRSEPPADECVFTLWPMLQQAKGFKDMNSTLKDCARQLLDLNPADRVYVTALYDKLGRRGYIPDYNAFRQEDMEFERTQMIKKVDSPVKRGTKRRM